MKVIKSIPCGKRAVEAYRTDSGEVLVELIETGETTKQIIWSHLVDGELRRAEDYARKEARMREREFLVSDDDGVRVVLITLDSDKDRNTIMLQFERGKEVSANRIFITLPQETVVSLFRHLLLALRFRPGEYAQ